MGGKENGCGVGSAPETVQGVPVQLLILCVPKAGSAPLWFPFPHRGGGDGPGDFSPDAPFSLLTGHSFQERRQNFPPYSAPFPLLPPESKALAKGSGLSGSLETGCYLQLWGNHAV